MNARLVKPKNILDANIDDLNEEELEEYLAALDQASDKTQSKMKTLDAKCADLTQKIERCDQRIEAAQDDIAIIDTRINTRDEEYDRIIANAFSKFERTEKDTPLNSPDKHSESSVRSSTPPSKASVNDDLSSFSSFSLSNRSDSNSDGERKKSKDSPQSTKQTFSSQAKVNVALLPAVQLPKEANPSHLTEKSSKQQKPATLVSAAPQQQKGLLARLGINKKISTPQQQQLPAAASSGSVVQQRVVR